MLALVNGDFGQHFLAGYGKLGPVLKDLAGLQESACGQENVGFGLWGRTVGPGLPCICALMFHGRSGFPYSRKTAFVQMVYLSSESIRRPSMSKRQARMAGSLGQACASAVSGGVDFDYGNGLTVWKAPFRFSCTDRGCGMPERKVLLDKVKW